MMQVFLIVQRQQAPAQQIRLGRSTLIGRVPECNLRIANNQVSRQHCRITVGERTVTVCDLGSANGTQINGKDIPANTEVEVRPGSRMTVGPLRFLFEFEIPAAAAPRIPIASDSTKVFNVSARDKRRPPTPAGSESIDFILTSTPPEPSGNAATQATGASPAGFHAGATQPAVDGSGHSAKNVEQTSPLDRATMAYGQPAAGSLPAGALGDSAGEFQLSDSGMLDEHDSGTPDSLSSKHVLASDSSLTTADVLNEPPCEAHLGAIDPVMDLVVDDAVADGQFADGQFADGQFADGQFSGGRFADDQFTGDVAPIIEPGKVESVDISEVPDLSEAAKPRGSSKPGESPIPSEQKPKRGLFGFFRLP